MNPPSNDPPDEPSNHGPAAEVRSPLDRWRLPPDDVLRIYGLPGRAWSIPDQRDTVQVWLNAGQWADVARFVRRKLAPMHPSQDDCIDCWLDFQVRVKVRAGGGPAIPNAVVEIYRKPAASWTDRDRRTVRTWHGSGVLESARSAFDDMMLAYDPAEASVPGPAACSSQPDESSPIGAAAVARRFNVWLLVCLGHFCVKWGQRRARIARVEIVPALPDVGESPAGDSLESKPSHDPTPFETAAGAEQLSLLRDCLARLNAIDRHILIWHYVEGLSDAEILDRFSAGGVPLSARALRVRRMRALRKVRPWMEAGQRVSAVGEGGCDGCR